jgi:metal-responsive CopG/Arc/MetJ family transcriptional regulator
MSYSVTFPKKLTQMLEELANDQKTTKNEIIKRAIALYNYLHHEVCDKGNMLKIYHDDKPVKRILFKCLIEK